MDSSGRGDVPDVRLDAHAPSSVLRTIFGGLLDFSPVKRADSEAMLKELARRQEEADYHLTPKEARVVANLQTTMGQLGNAFFLTALVGTALLTRTRPKNYRWARWPLCFSVALVGQEHANNTAPFAVISTLATMDSPVGGEMREIARERLPQPAFKLIASQMPQQEAGSPTLRILMDPAERAHLESALQQRAEAARTQGPAPRGLDRPPRPSRPLPRQQGSLWEQSGRPGRQKTAEVSDGGADDAMQDAFNTTQSDAMFRDQAPSSRSMPGKLPDQTPDMTGGAPPGDVFPTDGDPWLSGEGDGDQQGMDPQLSRQQRRTERRRARQSPGSSGGGDSLDGYFDDRWDNSSSSRPQ